MAKYYINPETMKVGVCKAKNYKSSFLFDKI